jgi:putative hydrolase
MLKIDLHIHTLASGHAQNTILEYINQAKRLNMKVIGISDHGPSTDSLANETYFVTLRRIPSKVNGVRILKGIEANIISPEGNIDISDNVINKLDYIMAGFHLNQLYSDKGEKENTEVIISAIRQGKINILTHPFVTSIFPVDVRKVSEEACKNSVLLEVNLHYIKRFIKNKKVMSNLKTMIKVVKKNNKKVILGSDAHNIWELADDSAVTKIKKEIGLTDKSIINNYPDELFGILKCNKK